MTPQEKAKELVDKFIFIDNGERFQIISITDELRAKECALIAVNLLIESTPSMDIYPPNCKTKNPKVKEYWKDVKQEIEKL